jgi:hypothetical protein
MCISSPALLPKANSRTAFRVAFSRCQMDDRVVCATGNQIVETCGPFACRCRSPFMTADAQLSTSRFLTAPRELQKTRFLRRKLTFAQVCDWAQLLAHFVLYVLFGIDDGWFSIDLAVRGAMAYLYNVIVRCSCCASLQTWPTTAAEVHLTLVIFNRRLISSECTASSN